MNDYILPAVAIGLLALFAKRRNPALEIAGDATEHPRPANDAQVDAAAAALNDLRRRYLFSGGRYNHWGVQDFATGQTVCPPGPFPARGARRRQCVIDALITYEGLLGFMAREFPQAGIPATLGAALQSGGRSAWSERRLRQANARMFANAKLREAAVRFLDEEGEALGTPRV